MEVKQHKEKQPKYPAWFAYFVEHEFKPLKKKVEEIDELLHRVIRLNNLKTEE